MFVTATVFPLTNIYVTGMICPLINVFVTELVRHRKDTFDNYITRVCCVTSIKLFDIDIPSIIHKIKFNMTGATNGARIAYPSGEHDLIPVLVVFVLLGLWISVYYLSMVICLFVLFYFWLLYCLFFCELR